MPFCILYKPQTPVTHYLYRLSQTDLHVSSAPGHLKESAGQAVGQPTDSSMCNAGDEAITRSSEVARQDTNSNICMEESRQDVERTSSFPLRRRPARTSCYPSKGTPGAHVSKVTVAPHAEGPRPWTSKTVETGVMVQRNHHNQKSVIYRASSLPKIGEDDVDSGRISTQEAPEKAHYSHSTSVGVMSRGGAKSDHAWSGEFKYGRGGTHARYIPLANITYYDAAVKKDPDEKQKGGGTIFTIDPSGSQDSNYNFSKPQFPHPQVEVKRGERRESPGRISMAAKRRRLTGPASPYYGGSGVCCDASAP